MKKLRWGVLGTGHIVNKMAVAIQRSINSEWLGIAGRNEESSRLAAQKFQLERGYSSYQELVDDPDIDAVYIALLNHLHFEWAVKAAEAGKHVLCEKPLTLNATQAQRLKEVAEKQNVQIMEAFIWRFHAPHLTAKEWIDEGAIGEPAMFNAHFSFMVDQENSTRMKKEWGGGSLYDIGCYPLSWSRFFIGDEPDSVDARLIYHPAAQIDMRFAGTLYFPGGRYAQISSAFDMGNGSFYEVLGTKGRLAVQFKGRDNLMTISVSTEDKKKEWTFDKVEPYQLQVEAFAEAILKGEPLPYGIEDAIQNMRIIDAIFEADRTKRRVHI